MVHTAKFEGLPNVLLEALSLKKYIISTNCPTGPSEILNNGKYGWKHDVNDGIKYIKMFVNVITIISLIKYDK